MIRHTSYPTRCAQLVLSQSPILAISLFPGYVIAHPLPPQIQIQSQTAQGKEIRIDTKIPFDTGIELLLVVLILLFATFNFSMLRVYYIISTQPWKSPIFTSAIFYESIHWPEVTPSYIITTLQSLFKRGICSLRHLHVNFSSSVDSDSESPNSAARTSMNESDQYSKDQSDDKSTIFHHDLHIPQFRVQFKTFLARTIDRFKCSNKRHGSNAISPEMSTSNLSSMRTPTTANTSISSVATSHSPVLSLSPSSGFYSLVEKSPSIGQNNMQSYLGPPNPISLRNEISHMESKYSHSRRGSPLETISEEYEGVSTSEHQDTISQHSGVLSDPISHIFRTRDLSFIFFRPESPKDLQTIVINSLETSSTTPKYPPEVMLPVKSTFPGLKKITHAQTMANFGSPGSQYSAVFELTDRVGCYHMATENKFSKETFDSGHHRISPTESDLLVSASTDSSEVSFHSTMTSSRFISNERLVLNSQDDMTSTFPNLLTQFETQSETSKEAFHNVTSSPYAPDVCAHVLGSSFAKKRLMVESQALKVKKYTDRSDLVSIPSEDFV